MLPGLPPRTPQIKTGLLASTPIHRSRLTFRRLHSPCPGDDYSHTKTRSAIAPRPSQTQPHPPRLLRNASLSLWLCFASSKVCQIGIGAGGFSFATEQKSICSLSALPEPQTLRSFHTNKIYLCTFFHWLTCRFAVLFLKVLFLKVQVHGSPPARSFALAGLPAIPTSRRNRRDCGGLPQWRIFGKGQAPSCPQACAAPLRLAPGSLPLRGCQKPPEERRFASATVATLSLRVGIFMPPLILVSLRAGRKGQVYHVSVNQALSSQSPCFSGPVASSVLGCRFLASPSIRSWSFCSACRCGQAAALVWLSCWCCVRRFSRLVLSAIMQRFLFLLFFFFLHPVAFVRSRIKAG